MNNIQKKIYEYPMYEEVEHRLENDVLFSLCVIHFRGYHQESLSHFYDLCYTDLKQAIYKCVVNESVITALEEQMKRDEEELTDHQRTDYFKWSKKRTQQNVF